MSARHKIVLVLVKWLDVMCNNVKSAHKSLFGAKFVTATFFFARKCYGVP